MFKIIIAEFSYIKYQIHNTLIFVLGIILFAFIRDFNPLNLICFILFIQYISFTRISELKENRSFKYMQLNLSKREIASFRLISSIIGFILIYAPGIVVYLIFHLPPDGFHDTLQELIMFGALGLIAFYLYLILSDLFSYFNNKTGFVIFNIVVVGILLLVLVYTATSIRKIYIESISSGIIFILLSYLGALILALFSILTFQYRESHLGYK